MRITEAVRIDAISGEITSIPEKKLETLNRLLSKGTVWAIEGKWQGADTYKAKLADGTDVLIDPYEGGYITVYSNGNSKCFKVKDDFMNDFYEVFGRPEYWDN